MARLVFVVLLLALVGVALAAGRSSLKSKVHSKAKVHARTHAKAKAHAHAKLHAHAKAKAKARAHHKRPLIISDEDVQTMKNIVFKNGEPRQYRPDGSWINGNGQKCCDKDGNGKALMLMNSVLQGADQVEGCTECASAVMDLHRKKYEQEKLAEFHQVHNAEALNHEIAVLQRLISHAHDIQNGIPAKQARLDKLKAEFAKIAGHNDSELKATDISRFQALLVETNAKIDEIKMRIGELEQQKVEIEKEIAKLEAEANGISAADEELAAEEASEATGDGETETETEVTKEVTEEVTEEKEEKKEE